MIPAKNTTPTRIADLFMEHWVVDFGIPSRVLTVNGPQLTSKFFSTLCRQIGVKTVNTTENHRQPNEQVEKFNVIMSSRLRRYVAEQKRY